MRNMGRFSAWSSLGALAIALVGGCGGSVQNGGAGGSSATGGSSASGGKGGSTSSGGSGGLGGLGGFGATGGSSGTGAFGGSGGTGGGFVTAPHDPLPQIPYNGGRLLEHVQLVTVTFAGYPYESEIQSFGDFIVGSNWLSTVGSEYGIGSGTQLAKIVLQEQAPSTITDDDIQIWLAQKISDGTLPAPPALDSDYLYAVYYPDSTQIQLQGSLSCEYFGGYHNSVDTGSLRFSYAVMPTCNNQQEPPLFSLEISASHELIEAATDAEPLINTSGYMLMDENSVWYYVGGEVADLCVGENTTEGNYMLQRVWSNSAAAADQNPCVPASGPYFNVSISPSTPVAVTPGSSTTFQLTGWSTTPVSDWFMQVTPFTGTFQADATLDKANINNGKTATLTVKVPQGVSSGDYASVVVFSMTSQSDYTFWPAAVYVP